MTSCVLWFYKKRQCRGQNKTGEQEIKNTRLDAQVAQYEGLVQRAALVLSYFKRADTGEYDIKPDEKVYML